MPSPSHQKSSHTNSWRSIILKACLPPFLELTSWYKGGVVCLSLHSLIFCPIVSKTITQSTCNHWRFRNRIRFSLEFLHDREEQKGQTWLRNVLSTLFSPQSTKTFFCNNIRHGRICLGPAGSHCGPARLQCIINKALLVETESSVWGWNRAVSQRADRAVSKDCLHRRAYDPCAFFTHILVVISLL